MTLKRKIIIEKSIKYCFSECSNFGKIFLRQNNFCKQIKMPSSMTQNEFM